MKNELSGKEFFILRQMWMRHGAWICAAEGRWMGDLAQLVADGFIDRQRHHGGGPMPPGHLEFNFRLLDKGETAYRRHPHAL